MRGRSMSSWTRLVLEATAVTESASAAVVPLRTANATTSTVTNRTERARGCYLVAGRVTLARFESSESRRRRRFRARRSANCKMQREGTRVRAFETRRDEMRFCDADEMREKCAAVVGDESLEVENEKMSNRKKLVCARRDNTRAHARQQLRGNATTQKRRSVERRTSKFSTNATSTSKAEHRAHVLCGDRKKKLGEKKAARGLMRRVAHAQEKVQQLSLRLACNRVDVRESASVAEAARALLKKKTINNEHHETPDNP